MKEFIKDHAEIKFHFKKWGHSEHQSLSFLWLGLTYYCRAVPLRYEFCLLCKDDKQFSDDLALTMQVQITIVQNDPTLSKMTPVQNDPTPPYCHYTLVYKSSNFSNHYIT